MTVLQFKGHFLLEELITWIFRFYNSGYVVGLKFGARFELPSAVAGCVGWVLRPNTNRHHILCHFCQRGKTSRLAGLGFGRILIGVVLGLSSLRIAAVTSCLGCRWFWEDTSQVSCSV